MIQQQAPSSAGSAARLAFALVVGAALALSAACDTTVSTAQYLRCWPELTSAPVEGSAGDALTLTGRHVLNYGESAVDFSLDLAVTFGANRAVVNGAIGPYDLVEGSGACDACSECIADADEGCLGCDEQCEGCLADVNVVVPDGAGTVPLTLINGLGQSEPLSFTYVGATPTSTPTP